MASSKLNLSSSKWKPKLIAEIQSFYGTAVSPKLYIVGDTCWNSSQMCLASQLHICAALKLFISRYETMAGFLDAFAVWLQKDFWNAIEEAEYLIWPFVDASFLMQHDKGNTMAHIVLVMMSLYKHLKVFAGDSTSAAAMVKDIEMRW